MAKSLYICYFGVREPLVQTQVIPYLRELVKGGHEITLLTFEPTPLDAEGVDAGKAACGPDIDWHWLKYHKRLSVLATAWDVLQGVRFIRTFIAREKPDILHARVHVPALMAALARKFSRRKPKLLFDIRGFMPEEYTDAGLWPKGGWLYRGAKRVERWLMRDSDGFVVLTEKAREILFPESANTGYEKHGRPVEVIPCCVDLSRFEKIDPESREIVRKRLGIHDRYVMAYVGAFGGWYLTKETADLFGELKELKPEAFAMILTQSKPEMIEPLLAERGYQPGDYFIGLVPATEIPGYLSGADAAVSFIKNCYSKQASSPTKNAEYLISGLPMIANEGIGDVDNLVESYRVGALVGDFSSDSYTEAINKILTLNGVNERCRAAAKAEFDLHAVGGERYRRLYERILAG